MSMITESNARVGSTMAVAGTAVEAVSIMNVAFVEFMVEMPIVE